MKDIKQSPHEHYCGFHHGYWKHEYLTSDCTQVSSNGVEWFVARECPSCMAKLKDEYLTTMKYLMPEINNPAHGG